MNRDSAPLLLLRDTRPPWWAGVAGGAAAVVVTTLAIFPLREVVPAVSTGVVYLLGVLLVATWFGLWAGLGTAVACSLAFGWFHIPPTGQIAISEPENWVALVVFLVSAAIAASLAELARARMRDATLRQSEADLAADLARLLLGGSDVRAELGAAGDRLTRALDLDQPLRIELDEQADGDAFVLALHQPGGDGAQLGVVRSATAPAAAVQQRLRERIVPSLEAILGVALAREQLQREAVETQALRRSDDIKTALLRAVSHDLRSPLTAIAAAGEALASPTLTGEERAELATGVTGEAQRLAGLVDKLLDLSRLQGGAAQPRPQWCSVDEVLRAAMDEVGHPPGFNVAIDRDLPLVRADAAQLERAFANLIENATRYGGEHPVAVRARVVGHRMLIRIVDRGPGIAGPELTRVFEPFYRGADVRGDGHVGSGLGLAVVKGFVEANGGRVWAESLPRQGTTFVVELPLPPAEAAAAAEGAAAAAPAEDRAP